MTTIYVDLSRIVELEKNVVPKKQYKRKKNAYRIVMDEHKTAKSLIMFLFTNNSSSLLSSIRINVTYLRQLQSMGYPRRACAEALKQSNNRLEDASEMLLNNIETLIAVSRPSAAHDEDDVEQEADLVEDLAHLPELIALGAEPEVARALLTIHGNRLDRAAEEFLQKCKSVFNTTAEEDPVNALLERARRIVNQRGKTENDTVVRRDELNSASFPASKRARLDEQATADEQRRTALESIIPDLLRANDDSEASSTERDLAADHLDLSLDEEETFIRDYRQRLIDDGFWS